MQMAKNLNMTTNTVATSNGAEAEIVNQNLITTKAQVKTRALNSKANIKNKQHQTQKLQFNQILKSNSNNNSLSSVASSGDISILPNNSSYYNENMMHEQFSSHQSLDSPNSMVSFSKFLYAIFNFNLFYLN